MTRSLVMTGRRIVAPEATEQKIIAAWLDFRGLNWFHVPNGGWRHIATAAELKRAGVRRGIPDNWIVDRPPVRPDAIGCVFELKRERRGSLSPEQRYWLELLREKGYHTFVAKGAEDAIKQLSCLGYADL